MESKYDGYNRQNVASAPMNDHVSDFKSETINFKEPVFKSFADVTGAGKIRFREEKKGSPDLHHGRWLKNADAAEDFFTLASKDQWIKDPEQDWIWESNAETEKELLIAANPKEGKETNPDEFINHATIGTRVQDGQVLFVTNKNKQILYGQGCWQWATNPFQSIDGPRRISPNPIDLKKEQNWFVQNQNIVIITLKPGQIAVALFKRKPIILLPGRHCYNDPNFVINKKDVFQIEKESTNVKCKTITLVMILPGYLGLGYEKANPVLLKPGLHVSTLPSFQHKATIDTRTLLPIDGNNAGVRWPGSHYNHGNIHIVRVKQSEYGCARIDGKPRFLKPGLHIYNNPSFSFFGIKHRTDQLIEFENLRIIQVPTNQIGLGWEENRPILIEPGIWTKTNPLFRFDRFEPATKQKIVHGSITRYQVHNGEIGFAWNNAKVEELQPGIRVVDNPNFIFEMTKKKNEPVIKFGNIAHVTTRQGFCRPVYENGKLKILEAGYDKFDNPNLVVKDAFPIGQIILRLKQMEVLTRDRTPMLVTGQVTYEVVDPKNLIINLGYDKLEYSLEKSIDAILRHAFSLTDLSTISPDTHKSEIDNDESEKEKKKKNGSL